MCVVLGVMHPHSWKPNGQHLKPEKIQGAGSALMLLTTARPKGLSSVQGVLPQFVIEETAVDAKQLCGFCLVTFRLSQGTFE